MLKNKKIVMMSLLASAILMSACQPQQEKKQQTESAEEQAKKPDQSLQLIGEAQKLDLSLAACQDNYCPEISIERLSSNQPFVDAIIDQKILQILAQILPKDESAAASTAVAQPTVDDREKILTAKQKFEQQLWPFSQEISRYNQELRALNSSHTINIMIKPKILTREGQLVTVVLNMSEYSGGAHGSSSQQYFNFDLKDKKLVSLKDIVEKNQLAAFKAKAYQAFKTWVVDTELATDTNEYEQLWKFELTNNYYLTKNGLILQYGEYEIGPYVAGLPRLTIPYSELTGILKAQYLPQDLLEHAASTVQAKP